MTLRARRGRPDFIEALWAHPIFHTRIRNCMCTFERTETRNTTRNNGTKTRSASDNSSRRSSSSLTLRHWRTFQAVHDCGSFSEAAAVLHLTQPAVCYTIGVLQEHVGVPLYEIVGRRVVVTEEGKKLLSLSRHLLKSAIILEKYARQLTRYTGDRLHVFVENIFPCSAIVDVLAPFLDAHPEAGLLVDEAAPQDIVTMLDTSPASMAIGSKIPDGCVGEVLANIEYVPVFHSDLHFALPENMTLVDVHRFPRIAVRGETYTMLTRSGKPYALPAEKITVPNIDAALERLLSCNAYAWLPVSMVERSSARERLRILNLPEAERCALCFFLIQRDRESIPPLLADLADVIKKAFI